MSEALLKLDLYQNLISLPEGLTGEILKGQLHTHPRFSGKHIRASYRLGYFLGGPFDEGINGPGGWIILQEPGVHFDLDKEVVVPDLAGWRKERLPEIPDSHKFTVAPDWVCEVLSPSTASIDKDIKMPLYAHYGVKYLWLIDPKALILDAYKLIGGSWTLGHFTAQDAVSVEPFDAISFSPDKLI